MKTITVKGTGNVSVKTDLIFNGNGQSGVVESETITWTGVTSATNAGTKNDFMSFNFKKKEPKKGPYGNLFNKD